MNALFQSHDACFQWGSFYRDAARLNDELAQAIKSDLLSRGFCLGVDPRTRKFFFEDSK